MTSFSNSSAYYYCYYYWIFFLSSYTNTIHTSRAFQITPTNNHFIFKSPSSQHYSFFGALGSNKSTTAVMNSFGSISTKLYSTTINPNNPSSMNDNYYSGGGGGGNSKKKQGILSLTARESATIVEWEPISELQRRIEDGMYYDHFSNYWDSSSSTTTSNHLNNNNKQYQQQEEEQQEENENFNHVQAIFCGYKITKEERDRLKSANPNVNNMDDDDNDFWNCYNTSTTNTSTDVSGNI